MAWCAPAYWARLSWLVPSAPSRSRSSSTRSRLPTDVGFIDDPVYLSEAQAYSKSFQLDKVNTTLPVGPRCVAGYEGTSADSVAHYLPGTNTATDDWLKAYGIPREAALGGAETMYPEYRNTLKGVYVRPDKCERNCGGPRGGGPPPAAAAPAGGRR
jgi:hypothetical protein